MMQALDILLRPSPTPERQKAEALLATLSADDLIQGVSDTRLTPQQHLLLASVLGTRELISREHLLALLNHLKVAEPSLLPKLAQIVAVHLLQDEETYVALSQAVLGMEDFSLSARVLQEVFLYRRRKLDRKFVKYLASLSVDVILVLSGSRAQSGARAEERSEGRLPAGYAPADHSSAPDQIPDPVASGLYSSRELAVPALGLAADALEYVPVDLPALAAFWQPSLFFLLLDTATAPAYCEILRKIAHKQSSKAAQAGTLAVLEFLNDKIHTIVSINDYTHIQLLAGLFAELCVLQQSSLRQMATFLCRSLTMALLAFSSHPSHAIFDLILPCLSSIFNDLSLRQVVNGNTTFQESLPGIIQHYLQRCRFFIDKSEVWSLTEFPQAGQTLRHSPSALFLLEDGFHDPRYWREWFGGFKSRALQLVAKIAAAFPNRCFPTLSGLLAEARTLAGSVTISTVECPEYMTFDSVFAVVEQCMTAILRQARYESGFSVDGTSLLQIIKEITEFDNPSPVVMYRAFASYLYLYKDAAASPGPHDYVEQLLAFVREYIGVIFGKYLWGITFGGAPSASTAAEREDASSAGSTAPAGIPGSGKTAFCTLSQEVLAFRRLCGTRLQKLTESSRLLPLVFQEGGPTIEQVLLYLQSLGERDVITEHEGLLVNQSIVNLLSFVGEERSFGQHISCVLSNCYRVLQRVLQLQSVEQFQSEFCISPLMAGDMAAALRTSDPEVLQSRRSLLYAIMESELILPRVRQLYPEHESIGAMLPAVSRSVECILLSMQIPQNAPLAGRVPDTSLGPGGTPLRTNLLYAVSAEEVERCLGGRTRGVVEGPQKKAVDGSTPNTEPGRDPSVSTELEYVHNWLARCASSGLRVISLNPEQFYQLLSRLDMSRLPLHALKWLLRDLQVGRDVPHSVEVLTGFAQVLAPSSSQLEFLYDSEKKHVVSRFGMPPSSPYEQTAPLFFAGPQAIQKEAQSLILESLYGACRRTLCEKAIGADLLGVRRTADQAVAPATAIPAPSYQEAQEMCSLLSLLSRLGLLLLADPRGADKYALYVEDVSTWLCRVYGPRMPQGTGSLSLPAPPESLPQAIPQIASVVLVVCVLLLLAHKSHENLVSVCAGVIGQLFALLGSWGQDGLAADTLMPFVSFEGEGMDVLAYLQTELQAAAQTAERLAGQRWGGDTGEPNSPARQEAAGSLPAVPGGPALFSPLASQSFLRRARITVRDVMAYLGRLPAPANGGRVRNITLSSVMGRNTQEDSMDVNLGEYGMFDE